MFTINCRGEILNLEHPAVMGILNLTNDSFYSESRLVNTEAVMERASQMLAEGASILDLGAQSTRPGSTHVSAKDELKKLLPAMASLRETFPDVFISIDTYHSAVAGKCLEHGADMINDISGGNLDTNMISTVGAAGAPYICMHMKGDPGNMQSLAVYNDLIKDLLEYFIQKTEVCQAAGINDVIIDPGFGFAKTREQNFHLLNHLSIFQILSKPIMAGLSRKSTIYKTLGIDASASLNGTTVLHTLAIQNGANILRVHDVKEAMQVIQLMALIEKAQ